MGEQAGCGGRGESSGDKEQGTAAAPGHPDSCVEGHRFPGGTNGEDEVTGLHLR